MTGKQLDLEQMAGSILSAPYQKHSETSKAAAKSIKERVGSLRDQMLRWLRIHGPCTDEEIQLGMRMNPNTQRPRRVELVRAGKVFDCGQRKTKSGRMATLWRAS